MTPMQEVLERLVLMAMAMHQLRRSLEAGFKMLDTHAQGVEEAVKRLEHAMKQKQSDEENSDDA